MLTANIDIADRLINGQIGTVKHILTDRGNIVKIYILMDDSNAGLKKGNSYALGRQNKLKQVLDFELTKSHHQL